MATSTAASQICWPSRYWMKWLLLFFGSLIVGGVLAIIFKPTPPPLQVVQTPTPVPKEYVYVFEAYDTEGNEIVKADFVDAKGAHSKLGTRTRLKGVAGKREFFTFERIDTNPVMKLPAQEIVWHSSEDHKTWLKKDLRQKLAAVDPHYNRKKWDNLIRNFVDNSQSDALDYPIVFPTK